MRHRYRPQTACAALAIVAYMSDRVNRLEPPSRPGEAAPAIATAFCIAIVDLFGRASRGKLAKQEGDSRLRRRPLAIEKLDITERRQVLQLIDAFIGRGQLKRKSESRGA